jgi:hypothetical protein
MTDMEDDFDESQYFSPQAAKKVANNKNPLSKYFRTPGLHVSLPTKGKFMDEGEIEFTMNGEIPVYPMRAADELLLKSPDALMSGYAVEKLVESCVPAVKNPRNLSTVDLDVILLAIRAASFGEEMDIEARCPHCSTMNSYSVNLPQILSTLPQNDFDNEVRLNDDLVVSVRPYTLEIATKIAVTAFNEARNVQAAEAGPEETRQSSVSESFKRLTDLNNEMIVESIQSIATPDGVVGDSEMIGEFIENASRAFVKKIDQKLKDINSLGMDKNIHLTCSECSEEWDTKIEFDPTSFFGQGS